MSHSLKKLVGLLGHMPIYDLMTYQSLGPSVHKMPSHVLYVRDPHNASPKFLPLHIGHLPEGWSYHKMILLLLVNIFLYSFVLVHFLPWTPITTQTVPKARNFKLSLYFYWFLTVGFTEVTRASVHSVPCHLSYTWRCLNPTPPNPCTISLQASKCILKNPPMTKRLLEVQSCLYPTF